MIVITGTTLLSQENNSIDKTRNNPYTSLLWKVTGNNLTKPSYIYASVTDIMDYNRVNYHLGDTFYLAIEKADIIAIETHPDSTEKVFADPFYFNKLEQTAFRGLYPAMYEGFSNNGSSFFTDAFFYNTINKDGLMYILSKNRTNINTSPYSELEEENYEEPIEAFVYKASKKLNKELVGIHSFDDILYRRAAMIYDYFSEQLDLSIKEKSRDDYAKRMEMQDKSNDYIRRGDLSMIDSLFRIMNPGNVIYNGFYHPNAIDYANFLDSLMPTGSVFAVLVAQTMTGENGVIKLLQQKGYQVSPVQHFIQKNTNKRKKRIEKIRKKVAFAPYAPNSKIYTVNLPKGLIPSYMVKNTNFNAIDNTNSCFYEVSRYMTYMPLSFRTIDDVMLSVDSLLYEYIPGDIIQKTAITKAGFPGYDITHKTSDGNLKRMLFVVTPLEILSFNIGGKDKYIKKSKAGNQFINSINLHIDNFNDWVNISPSFGEFTIEMPGYTYADTGYYGINNSSVELTGWDKKSNAVYGFVREMLHDFSVLEEDTFELNYLTEQFAEAHNLKIAHREMFYWDNHPAIDFKLYEEEQKDTITGRFIIRGAKYYLLWTNAKNKEDVYRFIDNNLSWRYPVVQDSFRLITDTLLQYQVYSNCMKQESDFAHIFDYYSYKQKKDEDLDYESDEIYATYYAKTGDFIEVFYEKLHDYQGYINIDSLKADIKQFIEKESFVIEHNTFLDHDSILIFSYELTDTNSSRKIWLKCYYKNGIQYMLRTLLNKHETPSPFVTHFYNSFTPITHNKTGRDIFEDKGLYFLDNLASEDSLLRKQARNSLTHITFNDNHVEPLINFIDHPKRYYADLDLRTTIIHQLGKLKNSDILPFLAKKYADYQDTMTLQLAILSAISTQKTSDAYKKLIELMQYDLPLSDATHRINAIFLPVTDTLELGKQLFPELFEFTRYPEYKNPIYKLLSLLVDSNIIDIRNFPEEIILIKRNIAEEFKRENDAASEETWEYGFEEVEEVVVEEVSPAWSSNISDKPLSSEYNILRDLTTLQPYYTNDKEIQSLFDKTLASKNIFLKTKTALFMIRKNIIVHDSIIQGLCKDPGTRAMFYNGLQKINRIELFDSSFLKQKDIVYSMLFGDNYSNESDSVVFLEKRVLQNKFSPGWIYFFKTKEEDDENWQLAYWGVQPEDSTEIKTKHLFSDTHAETIYEDDDIESLIDDVMKQFRVYGRKRLWDNRYNYSYYF